jgi:hypothetical protein
MKIKLWSCSLMFVAAYIHDKLMLIILLIHHQETNRIYPFAWSCIKKQFTMSVLHKDLCDGMLGIRGKQVTRQHNLLQFNIGQYVKSASGVLVLAVTTNNHHLSSPKAIK